MTAMVEDTIHDVSTLRLLVKEMRGKRMEQAARIADLESDVANLKRYAGGLECRLEAALGTRNLAEHDAGAITEEETWGVPPSR